MSSKIVEAINNPDAPIPHSKKYYQRKTKPAPKKRAKKEDIVRYQPDKKVEPEGEIGSEKPGKPKRMTANQIAYQTLRATGLNHYKSCQELGLSKGYGYDGIKVAKKDYGDKIAALMPRSLKVIKSLSMGQPVGEMADIKGSDVIAANKMIWDRAAPIVQDTPISNTNSFTQININLNSITEKQPDTELVNDIVDLQS